MASDTSADYFQWVMLFHGMKRSGNHAIVPWIAAHFDSALVLYNNGIQFSPSSTRRQKRSEHWIHGVKMEGQPDGPIRRDALILTYEDETTLTTGSLSRAPSKSVIGDYDFIDLFGVIRDPYNMMASRMSAYDLFPNRPPMWTDRNTIEKWKVHARQAVEKSHRWVIYNLWVSDPEYRRRFEKANGWPVADGDMSAVSDYGHGSSFTGTSKPITAEEANTRYLKLAEKHRHLPDLLLKDREVQELSKTLFGWYLGNDSNRIG